jgi:hypothetical protein
MTINISGYGSFEIPNDKLQELIQWLEQNSIQVKNENISQQYNGEQLING